MAFRPSVQRTLVLSLFCFCFFSGSSVQSVWSYRAGVVEHTILGESSGVVTRDEALERQQKNLAVYAGHAAAARAQQVDILVFPEDGLYGGDFASFQESFPFCEPLPALRMRKNAPALPVPVCGNPSFNTSETFVFHEVACLAKTYNLTLVLTMCDRQSCSDPSQSPAKCPPTGVYQFNTQLAFDPSGNALSKYHKRNLFQGESLYFNPGPSDELRYFDTSFGVRFGQFICFDIFFRDPADLLVAAGIRDFVFSTYWDSTGTFPTILAHEMQQGWTYTHGTNLLAANIGEGDLTSGSGIYSSGQALSYIYQHDSHSDETLLVADVTPGSSQPAKVRSHRRAWPAVGEYPFANNTYQRFTVNASGAHVKLANKDFVCDLTYTGADVTLHGAGSVVDYVLVATNGYLLYPLLPATACAVMPCFSDSTSNCALPFHLQGAATFEGFKLQGSFAWGQIVVPTGCMSDGVLYSTDEMLFENNVLSFSSKANKQPLLHAMITAEAFMK